MKQTTWDKINKYICITFIGSVILTSPMIIYIDYLLIASVI